MINNLCAFAMSDLLEDFTLMQMVAMGAACVIALVLGIFIGGIIFYATGARQGKRANMAKAKKVLAEKKKKLELEMEQETKRAIEQSLKQCVEEVDFEIIEEGKASKHAKAEKAAKEAEAVKAAEIAKAVQAAKAAEIAKAVEMAKMAESAKAAEIIKAVESAKATEIAKAEAARIDYEKAAEEARALAAEAEQKARAAAEAKAQAENAAIIAAIPQKKDKITLLNKSEILDFAEDLDEYLASSTYARGGENLPDSCRVGICTYMLVYERKGMVKLVLRLHKKTAEALSKQYKLFGKAVCPKGGDWYKWILNEEVGNLEVVTATIRMAYKYTYVTNYDEDTKDIDVVRVNQEEAKLNAQVLRHKDVEDRDFVLASDNVKGASYNLYGKDEIANYVNRIKGRIAPTVIMAKEDGIAPHTFKIENRAFAMAYEKDGIIRLVFRSDEADFAKIKEKYKQAEVSTFPKAKYWKWYSVIIDTSFTCNYEIEEILKSAYNYVLKLYFPENGAAVLSNPDEE